MTQSTVTWSFLKPNSMAETSEGFIAHYIALRVACWLAMNSARDSLSNFKSAAKLLKGGFILLLTAINVAIKRFIVTFDDQAFPQYLALDIRANIKINISGNNNNNTSSSNSNNNTSSNNSSLSFGKRERKETFTSDAAAASAFK